MKLAEIDFDTPEHLISQRGAQHEFLREIKRTAPEVLDDLSKGPFALYREIRGDPVEYHRRLRGEELTAKENERANAHPYITSAIWRDMAEGKADEFEPLVESLRCWSQRWNLDEDWCRAFAFFALANWLMVPEKRTKRDWNYMSIDWGIPFEVEVFKFEWAWHPLRNQRANIESVMRKMFEEQMKEYLDGIEKRLIDQSGAVRALTKTQSAHFAWLVSYQIKGESQLAISKRVHASRQTAADGIKLTANLCDLKLRRRNPPGRPRRKPPGLSPRSK
jgi:hypothetical protein